MEDALARHCTGCDCGIPVWVLILVVMEDALAPNPDYQKHVIALVLILVVMEDALALCSVIGCMVFILTVLILVVMEDALALCNVVPLRRA